MQKSLLSLLLIFVLSSCSSRIEPADLTHLQGYWEISEVVFPDGYTKPYTVNTTVDYIHIEELQGYIKKMKPGLNGRYQTSNKAAPFSLIQKNDQWELHFETDQNAPLILLELHPEKYTVKDQGQVRYYYKRYEPINISDE